MTKLCTFFFLICTLAVGAQDKLDKAIDLLENNYSQEKIHLLTDKEKYISGDQIWFKAFAFDGYRRSEISGTVYVELYDRNKKLIDSRTVPLSEGEGHGSLKLTPDLSEDIYYLRAVTPYMSNFPRNFDFVKMIPVYNPASESKLVPIEDNSWNITAVPEGFKLIQNRETKVAVRLHSNGNPPAKWEGYLTDTSDPQTKIVRFNAMDANVGSFTFTPKANAHYRVHVQDNTGKSKEISLPLVAPAGVHLKVKHQQDGTGYTLSAVGMPQGLMNYKVVGTIGNRLAYRANILKPSQVVNATIPSKINEGQAGVLQISVFNENDIVVAQRLVFINSKRSGINTSLVKPATLKTGARERNSVELNFAGSATVAVKSATAANDEPEDDLLSALWLTGDIKTPVHRPAQYFGAGANDEALDALLMSEKWTFFNWDSLLMGQVPKQSGPMHRFLSYEGRLALNSRPIPNQRVMLMTRAEEGLAFTPLTTDKEGKIYLNNVYIDEPLDISFFLDGQNKEERTPQNLTLSFRMLKPGLYTGGLPPAQFRLVPRTPGEQVSPELALAVAQQQNEDLLYKDAQLIEEVKLRAQKKDLTKKLDKELSSGMFRAGSSTVFDFVNDDQNVGAAGNILDWLQGRASGLIIERNQGVSYPVIRGRPARIFLDEFPSDADVIASLPVSSIAMVKVQRTGTYGGEAILIYTKRGYMGGSGARGAGPNKTLLTGYDLPATPDVINLTTSRQTGLIRDTRGVLYWNPQHTGSPLEFLNSDVASSFRIMVIGFDGKGNLHYYDRIHGR